jgi:methionine-rich copper-binding protein CopC
MLAGALLTATVALPSGGVWAHAFMKRSEPRAGATLSRPPAQVRVWFEGPIEPLYVWIRIEDARKGRVDHGDARVNARDDRLVEAAVAPLPAGRYRVYWSVIARDGHAKEGDFAFGIR